ncbi:MAG: hypothetical protein MJ238_07225, partial [Bacilli bacterium]|nr:hypothetical protein [Bacilli bacterium]
MKKRKLFIPLLAFCLTGCAILDTSSKSVDDYSYTTNDKNVDELINALGIKLEKDSTIEVKYFKVCNNGKLYKYKVTSPDIAGPEVISNVYAGNAKLFELNNYSYYAAFIMNDGTCVRPEKAGDCTYKFDETLFTSQEIREIQNENGISKISEENPTDELPVGEKDTPSQEEENISPEDKDVEIPSEIENPQDEEAEEGAKEEIPLTPEERLLKAANITLSEEQSIALYGCTECQTGWFYVYQIEPYPGGIALINHFRCGDMEIISLDNGWSTLFVNYDMTVIKPTRNGDYYYP